MVAKGLHRQVAKIQGWWLKVYTIRLQEYKDGG